MDEGLRQLMIAIENDDVDVISSLVCEGTVDLGTVDPGWMMSPLALAVDAALDGAHQEGTEPDLRIVRMLVEAGASPLSAGPRGATALSIAREREWQDAVELLERAATTRG